MKGCIPEPKVFDFTSSLNQESVKLNSEWLRNIEAKFFGKRFPAEVVTDERLQKRCLDVEILHPGGKVGIDYKFDAHVTDRVFLEHFSKKDSRTKSWLTKDASECLCRYFGFCFFNGILEDGYPSENACTFYVMAEQLRNKYAENRELWWPTGKTILSNVHHDKGGRTLTYEIYGEIYKYCEIPNKSWITTGLAVPVNRAFDGLNPDKIWHPKWGEET